jgi:di/tripeptidase
MGNCCLVQSKKITEMRRLLGWIEFQAKARVKAPRSTLNAKYDSKAYMSCANKAAALSKRALEFSSNALTVQTTGPNGTITMERVANPSSAGKFALDVTDFVANNLTSDLLRTDKNEVERLFKPPTSRARLCTQVRRMNLSKQARVQHVMHWRKLALEIVNQCSLGPRVNGSWAPSSTSPNCLRKHR